MLGGLAGDQASGLAVDADRDAEEDVHATAELAERVSIHEVLQAEVGVELDGLG